MKRKKTLNSKYYINLDYDETDKQKALRAIHNLSKTVKFNKNSSFPEKLKELANKIQKNFVLFASVCKHIDVYYTILNYVTNWAARIEILTMNKSCKMMNLTLNNLLSTLFTICRESEIQLFFTYYFLNYESCVTPKNIHNDIRIRLKYQESEMIILKDSDLYAVVNNLRITSDHYLYKIWVQKEVEEKFLWLIKKHYHSHLHIPVDTFQSLKDIQLHVCGKERPFMKIVSIWSEDIVAAKNLALSLNSHVVFINTYMDFYGSNLILQFEDIEDFFNNEANVTYICENEYDEVEGRNLIYLSGIVEKNAASICDLFYDGTWQKPIMGMYWKHNDTLCANATNYDIVKCYASAEKGFETWSIKSIKIRTQILSKFVSILKDNSKFGLAIIIERLLKYRYLQRIQGFHNMMVEVICTRKPAGVFVLKEENENILFFRLILMLIAGNSVIVMFDPNCYNLTPYCDMFSTCGIPPGVINVLSSEDAIMLTRRLCALEYSDYANKYFLKPNLMENYILQYTSITLSKQIMLHLL